MSEDGQQAQIGPVLPIPTEFTWITSIEARPDKGFMVRNQIGTVHGVFVFFLPAQGAIEMGEQLRKLGIQAKTGIIVTGDMPDPGLD